MPEKKRDSQPIILVVEDSPVIRQIAVFQLARFAVEVHYAANGHEALKLFQQYDVSLVLMDVAMPGMDGLEATRSIRELEKASGQRTPIIAITASENRANCIEAGMDDYVTKPADYDRVLAQWLPDVESKSA
jgi:two-component system sensor histidine kinase/response regulator